MEKLSIEGTAKTPFVSFDATGKLEMRGRSIPENSIEFFQPLIDWVDAYGKEKPAKVDLDVKLEYFNTSSSKCILDLFKRLEKMESYSDVVINWYYEDEDEDMQEAGEDYASIVQLKFNIIGVDEI